MGGESTSIEDRIIDDVESNTGDDFSPSVDTGNSDDGSSSSAEPTRSEQQEPQSEAQRGRDNQNRREDRGAQKGKGNKEGKDNKDKQQQQAAQRDAKGNLVDKDGKVIAQHGAERRLHYQNERLKEHNGSLTRQVSEANARVQQMESLLSTPRSLGLSNQDVSTAFHLAGIMKKDPVKGARAALEYAISQGVDLNQVVNAEGLQNISMGAQRRMMEEFHSRSEGPRQQQQQREAVMQRSKEQALRFANEHPDAEEHFDDIGRMIPEIIKQAESQGRKIDPYSAAELALHKLQQFAMQKGLDPNRSIQSQIDEFRARQNTQRPNGGQQQRRDVRQTQPRRQAPMPNGSRGVDTVPQGRKVSANTPTDAIVRQAMLDAGYNFN